jgi:hypothetical protein
MTDEAKFEVLATMWTEAFHDARVLCGYRPGAEQPDGVRALLAAAHEAVIDEGDPREFLAQLSTSAVAYAPTQLA